MEWSRASIACATSPNSSMMASRAAARPDTMPNVSSVMISVHSNDRTPSSSLQRESVKFFISRFPEYVRAAVLGSRTAEATR